MILFVCVNFVKLNAPKAFNSLSLPLQFKVVIGGKRFFIILDKNIL
jgi:hypothetical protein